MKILGNYVAMLVFAAMGIVGISLIWYSYEIKAQSKKPIGVINLGEYVILAYVDNSNKVVTFYERINLVCFENTGFLKVTPATNSLAAYNCWDTDYAPKMLQELVRNRK